MDIEITPVEKQYAVLVRRLSYLPMRVLRDFSTDISYGGL